MSKLQILVGVKKAEKATFEEGQTKTRRTFFFEIVQDLSIKNKTKTLFKRRSKTFPELINLIREGTPELLKLKNDEKYETYNGWIRSQSTNGIRNGNLLKKEDYQKIKNEVKEIFSFSYQGV